MVSCFSFDMVSQNLNHQKATGNKVSNEVVKPTLEYNENNNKKELNLYKVDEKGNYRGKSLPSQNLSETPYKREEETKPVNNSKANTPK